MCVQYKAWHGSLSHGENFWFSFAVIGVTAWVIGRSVRRDR